MTVSEQWTDSRFVLVVDDDASWLESIAFALERSGIGPVMTCGDGNEAKRILGSQPVRLLLLDLTMPDMSGEELLAWSVSEHPQTPVIILTGLDQTDIAVRCMKVGAFDYLVKTIEEDALIHSVRNALRTLDMEWEYQRLKTSLFSNELEHPEAFSSLVTQDPAMHSIFRYIESISATRATVLISGESGVGKDLIAKSIHTLGSPDGPFVAVNIAGLDDNVFSDTLFGHVKGAFTGAERARPGMVQAARGGTLFLDEIGDLSASSQVKLLRLLQNREYFPLGSDTPSTSDARVVVATNQSLDALQTSGTFRKDLYYRLRTHCISVPPLRARPWDVRLLVGHFLAEAAAELNKKPIAAPEAVVSLLSGYSFPGNVRELRSIVFDAMAQHRAGALSLIPFRKAIGVDQVESSSGVSGGPLESASAADVVFPKQIPTIKGAVEQLVREAMSRSGGNQTIAAAMLGITQPSLSRRLRILKESADSQSSFK
ncbi:MAG: sigma-54-dependent Fis family transcriptional regulator [Denitromonas halophila]|nr:MAG: sigma-54-dependent Fis family transcriptional regulator [Denitromonas halophila]TVT67463.1 MAG: sigma-54-dependent Fis family transcriptional regulator [Denitromonas halophila]